MLEQRWTPEFSDDDSDESSSTFEDLKLNDDYSNHLIFFVHGYHGNSEDLRHYQNSVLQRYPEARVYSCKNIAKTSEYSNKNDLQSLAKIIAREIRDEIIRVEDKHLVDKISMVGYSMGGLVIRAALKYLFKW